MNNDIIISAGLVIIQDNKILLCHPTGNKWWGTYSIPKGHVEEGEDPIEAAIRETFEETGVIIEPNDIEYKQYVINYKDVDQVIYKKVYYFIVHSKDIVVDKSQIQKEEVDWVGFVDKKEAEKRIFWKLKEVLKHII
jgi:ADP-ribose pyrophosphatase YjhB (NUDIX family)